MHNQSDFPCDVPNCPRIEGKGYFKEVDLLKHRRKEHPEAPTYNSSERTFLIACQELQCSEFGTRQFTSRMQLYIHYAGRRAQIYIPYCRGPVCTQEEAYQKAGYTLQSKSLDTQTSLGGPSA